MINEFYDNFLQIRKENDVIRKVALLYQLVYNSHASIVSCITSEKRYLIGVLSYIYGYFNYFLRF
jgi:hypothetical protein